MIKKTISMLCIMIMISFVAVGCQSKSPFEYTTMDFEGISYIAITKYNLDEKKVVIPDTIDNKPVGWILSSAFFGKDIEVLDLGGVIEIQNNAFYMNKKLREIHFGNNITLIGESAFGSCFELEVVSFPTSLQTIQIDAFAHANSLKEIHFAGNPIQIEDFLGDNINVIIYGPSSGTVESYAIDKGLTFVANDAM